MTLFLVVCVIVVCLYVIMRINNLEREILQLRKTARPETRAEQVGQPSTAINMAHVPPPPPKGSASYNVGTLEKPVPPEDGFEFKLGGKFFTIIGAIAVLFGVGFFLRYAFEQNWISEVMRIVLGVIAGAILLTIGEYLKEKYTEYSHVLTGTGIGVLYVSFFSAYSSYGLYSQGAALFALIIVSLLGAYLAIRADSQKLAGLAQFAGYVTPLLLGMVQQSPANLFIYIALLNIGVLLMAMWKVWRGLTLGSLVGSAIVYVVWHSNYYTAGNWAVPFTFLTIFFVTFLAVNAYRYFIEHRKSDENDLALVVFNPIFYFLACYAVIYPVDQDYLGPLAFILGGLYLVLGMLIRKDNPDARIFHFGVASILLFIGVPIQFNHEWITVGWAVEASLLLYYGVYKQLRGLQMIAHAVFLIVVIRLITIDAPSASGLHAVFNGRGLEFALVLALMAFTAWNIYRKDDINSDSISLIPGSNSAVPLPPSSRLEKVEHSFEIIVIEILTLLVFWSGMEILEFGNHAALGPVWALIALLALNLGIVTGKYGIRTASMLISLLAMFRVMLYDIPSSLSADIMPIFNMRVFSTLSVVVIMGVMLMLVRAYRKNLTEQENLYLPRAMFLGLNLLLFSLVTEEVRGFFANMAYKARMEGRSYSVYVNLGRAGMSVAWLAYGSVLLILGIAKKSAIARLLSMGLFGVVIFKVFLYDTSQLSNFFRFISFISLGAVLLIAGYLYNKHKDRIVEFVQIKNVDQ